VTLGQRQDYGRWKDLFSAVVVAGDCGDVFNAKGLAARDVCRGNIAASMILCARQVGPEHVSGWGLARSDGRSHQLAAATLASFDHGPLQSRLTGDKKSSRPSAGRLEGLVQVWSMPIQSAVSSKVDRCAA